MPIPLLAGMLYAAAGYKNHQAGERARERQDKADARQDVVNSQSDAKHEALMAEEARRVKEAQRLIDNRESDAKAFAPVAAQDVATEYAGPNANSPGVVDDPLMQGLIEKQTAKRNTMDSRTQRLADNQAATGRVADSMATMDTQVVRTRSDAVHQQQQDAIAKKVKEEGLIETAQAARTGDAQAVFERFNSGGTTRLDAVPTVQAVKRNVNGLGEITDYIYSGTTTGPDGKKVPFQKSAFDMSMQVMPFEKQLSSLQKGEEIANRGALQAAQADAATMRAMLAQSKQGAGGKGAAEAPVAFNPLGTFDSKKAQAVAFDQAAAATGPDGKPLTPDAQGQLAQKIYRSMEDSFANENSLRERARVFKSEAMKAKTPEEIQAVRERALQSGYSDQEMLRLDPRFAPPPKPAPAEPKPQPKATPKPEPQKPQSSSDRKKPAHYVGIDKVSASRGSSAGYTFAGVKYPTEEAALEAYYKTK